MWTYEEDVTWRDYHRSTTPPTVVNTQPHQESTWPQSSPTPEGVTQVDFLKSWMGSMLVPPCSWLPAPSHPPSSSELW